MGGCDFEIASPLTPHVSSGPRVCPRPGPGARVHGHCLVLRSPDLDPDDCGRCSGLTQRAPKFALRLDGVLLLRLADRMLTASLLKLPPRFTRLEPLPTRLRRCWYYGQSRLASALRHSRVSAVAAWFMRVVTLDSALSDEIVPERRLLSVDLMRRPRRIRDRRRSLMLLR